MQAFPYVRFPVNKKHSALFVTVCAKKEYTEKKKKKKPQKLLRSGKISLLVTDPRNVWFAIEKIIGQLDSSF